MPMKIVEKFKKKRPNFNLVSGIVALIRINYKNQCLLYAGFSLNRSHWADSVIELPCPDVAMSVCLCHWVHFFRPLIGPEVT